MEKSPLGLILQTQIDELKKRIEELERRPIYHPVYYPNWYPQQPYTQLNPSITPNTPYPFQPVYTS